MATDGWDGLGNATPLQLYSAREFAQSAEPRGLLSTATAREEVKPVLPNASICTGRPVGSIPYLVPQRLRQEAWTPLWCSLSAIGKLWNDGIQDRRAWLRGGALLGHWMLGLAVEGRGKVSVLVFLQGLLISHRMGVQGSGCGNLWRCMEVVCPYTGEPSEAIRYLGVACTIYHPSFSIQFLPQLWQPHT